MATEAKTLHPRTWRIDQWWTELERLEEILGQVGPDEVCCEGLTPRQTAVLRILVAQEGARLTELAAASRVSPSAMTRIIEKLEKLQLVQRVRGVADDGRAAMVRITTEGRAKRARIDDLMRERTRNIIMAIPADRRHEVLESLRLLNDAVAATTCCGLNNEAKDTIVPISESGEE